MGEEGKFFLIVPPEPLPGMLTSNCYLCIIAQQKVR